MNVNKYRGDLVVLTADKDMEFFLKGVLNRPESLGIKLLSFEIYRHPQKDPGCFLTGHDFLRPFINRYEHALVILDREGCGKEILDRAKLEDEVEGRLSSSGWGERSAAIVIDPELENWLWSSSPEVDTVLGWKGKSPKLCTWLSDKGFLSGEAVKPRPPKQALQEALRYVRKPWSSSLFHQIAKKVSLQRCSDPAFFKLKEKLRQWFAQ